MPALSYREQAIRALLREAREVSALHQAAQGASEPPMSPDLSSDSSMELSSASSSASSMSLDPPAAESEDEDDVYLHNMQVVEEALLMLSNTRVLRPAPPVEKSSQLPLVLGTFKNSDPKRFRRNLRVSPSSFDRLLSLIEDDPVFTNESPSASQLPVDQQLAITLYRLGHSGNAASVESIAQWAGVSAGLVFVATERVFIAVLGLHDDAIRWAVGDEKEAAKAWVEAVSCPAWRDGFCMVDGTLIPLFEKPGWHGETFFSRKMVYALNLQVISLPNCRIIDYVLGHVGSQHDSTCFEDSRVVKEHNHLFEDGEWIWADSAYALRNYCITPYKRPQALLPENKRFNYWVSRVRVKSEHVMGLLKGRFHSLRQLRQQISSEEAHHRALAWVRVCVVLHNLIHRIEHDLGEVDEEFTREMLREGQANIAGEQDPPPGVQVGAPAAVDPAQRLAAGQRRREELRSDLFDWLNTQADVDDEDYDEGHVDNSD